MSRATIIILVVAVAWLSAAALWVVLPRGAVPVATEPSPAADDAERRQRTQISWAAIRIVTFAAVRR